jgi:hypothetical protein
MEMKLYLDNLNGERAQNFFNIYALDDVISDTDSKFIIGQKKPRMCRFCKRKEPEVKFKKDAHVIPEFMGNKHLLSYFECDNCNDKFSLYKDSFSKFIGASRTISQIPGKSGVPKHKDPKTGFSLSFDKKGLQIGFMQDSNEVKIIEDTKKLEIITKRQSYIPIYIPKSILKIGFCMLKDNELQDYEMIREILQCNEYDSKLKDNNFLRIFGYFIPGPPIYYKPFIHLYDKLSKETPFPQKQVVVFYANYIFQMVMPFSKKDSWLNGKKINLPIYPLLIDVSHFEKYGNYQQLHFNFTSSEKIKEQEHILTFSYENMIKKK